MPNQQFAPAEWATRSAALIQDAVNAILAAKGQCSLMLTGGRSAEKLYLAWAELPEFSQMSGVEFYFGDERCVPPNHPESNYGMAMQSLFGNGVPAGCTVLRMLADEPDHDAAALRYEQSFPSAIDVLLLGVGEDGHIASLFPGAAALAERVRRVLPVTCPKPPADRLTVTLPVIAAAKSVFVLATGAAKAAVLASLLKPVAGANLLPANEVLHAIWLTDTALPTRVGAGDTV